MNDDTTDEEEPLSLSQSLADQTERWNNANASEIGFGS